MKNPGLDKDELDSLYRAFRELDDSWKVDIYGIYQEDDGTWIATSEKFDEWHCHGKGSTIYSAVIDMAAKVMDYLNKKNEDIPQ